VVHPHLDLPVRSDARLGEVAWDLALVVGDEDLEPLPEDREFRAALEVSGTQQEGPRARGVDLLDAEELRRLFEVHGPFTGVIHTAAYTAVDKAEEEEDKALRINGEACGILAQACADEGIPLVVVSTDFVFDGTSDRPYREDHPVAPLSAYGRTKLAGERAALEAHPSGAKIVRTQWLYGPRGKHFPGTMLALAQERDELKVVSDQIGAPTSTLELAPALWDVLLHGEPGIYHASCEGSGSWYDFAVSVFEAREIDEIKVEPCSTEEFPRPAVRPAYSVLDCSKLTALREKPLLDWREALETFLGGSHDS
ncbi:MAG: dTDP-4-dehydrorhamnose reductase, partial [Planctomycetota bacterium]